MAAHSQKADVERLWEERALPSHQPSANHPQTGASVPMSWRVISPDGSATRCQPTAQTETAGRGRVLKPHDAAPVPPDGVLAGRSPDQNADLFRLELEQADEKGRWPPASRPGTASDQSSSAKRKIEMPKAEPALELPGDHECDGEVDLGAAPHFRGEPDPSFQIAAGASDLNRGPLTAGAAGRRLEAGQAGSPRPETAASPTSAPLVLKPKAFDSDLSRVIHAWFTLSPPLRQAILAVIDTATPS